ncbi:M23 family metallopeptidase [Candidatus Dependentiae bacterium]|nr:MAG: M23 family metallopeptidase [Candidatus Dependentiae bacterium]
MIDIELSLLDFLSERSKQDESFVVVNRELLYLRKAARNFITQEYGSAFVLRISDDEFLEYTDVLTQGIPCRYIQPNKRRSVLPIRSRKKKNIHHMSLSSDIVFLWPVERSKCWLSSLFGPRPKLNGLSGFHHGLDMAAFRGTPVKAAASGIVIEARYARGYGKTILIAHTRKYKTRYAHLDKICVCAGQKVKGDTIIGLVGSTGNVRTEGEDGSHLHFEVYSFNRPVNPLYFLTA